MKTLITLTCLILTLTLSAQPTTNVPESKASTLRERFYEMKTNAETYTEYKVIKEYQLDRMWKMINDSLTENHRTIASANAEIKRLGDDIAAKQILWTEKENSFNDLEFAGTHISFLGINFSKKTFITIFLLMVGGLLFVSGLIVLRMKGISASQKDKADLMSALTSEYEEYKHKALEKQMKLSRELQNERNRLSELKKI